MVEAIVKELEALKSKVEEAIQHVKSGVNTLNEDQQAALKGMVVAIERKSQDVTDAVHNLLDPVEREAETLVEKIEHGFEVAKDKVEHFLGIEPKPEQLSPADLDAAVAERQAATEAANSPEESK